MSRYLHKCHNVSVLLYHVVCPAKYRRVVFDEDVDAVLKEVCLEIALRYEIFFLEIGTDGDHVHFLVQSVPSYGPAKIVRTIKSLIAREVFARCPQVKKKLWGGQFWSDGYFIASVGQHANVDTIGAYVRGQGTPGNYKKLHVQQLTLFEALPDAASWQPPPHKKLHSTFKYLAACRGDSLFGRREQQGPLHLVSAWASEQGLSLGQECVPAKSNEITAIPLLLDRLHLKNTLFTLDAMGCQTKIAQQILDRGADYLLVLKANHRLDYTTVQAHFLGESAPYPSPHRLVCDAFDEGHGRLVRRRVFSSQDPALLAALSAWPSLRTVLAVESIRRVSGQAKVETQMRYFLCSGGDDPILLAQAIRRHWTIENNLHWVLRCPLGGWFFGKMTVA